MNTSLRRHCRRAAARLKPRVGHDDGYATVWTALTGFILIVLAGLIVAAGVVFGAQERGYDLAQAAARAGAQEIDLDVLRADGQVRLNPARAITRARQFLTRAGATGTVTATTVSVTVTATTRQPTTMLARVGVDSVTVTSTGRATPVTDATV